MRDYEEYQTELHYLIFEREFLFRPDNLEILEKIKNVLVLMASMTFTNKTLRASRNTIKGMEIE